MTERLNLMVDEGISDLLTELAGGERKRGQWLSDLVRGMAYQTAQVSGDDFDVLKMSHAGLVGKVKALDGRYLALDMRVAQLEAALAAPTN